MSQCFSRGLGRHGEELAMKFLEEKGYRILERNYSTPFGEIDIIACYESPHKTARLVFVEVKMRRSRKFGYPEESITPKKLNHLIQASQDYLQRHSIEDLDWQIDVISIEMFPKLSADIRHIENVTLPLKLPLNNGSNG